MAERKTLQDLTIKDNFMFGAVMMDEEICREFLELVLGFRIAKVTVSKEKCFVYHPEYKGVRLDILAADEKNIKRLPLFAVEHIIIIVKSDNLGASFASCKENEMGYLSISRRLRNGELAEGVFKYYAPKGVCQEQQRKVHIGPSQRMQKSHPIYVIQREKEKSLDE